MAIWILVFPATISSTLFQPVSVRNLWSAVARMDLPSLVSMRKTGFSPCSNTTAGRNALILLWFVSLWISVATYTCLPFFCFSSSSLMVSKPSGVVISVSPLRQEVPFM